MVCKMDKLLAWLVMGLLASRATADAANDQLSNELEDYATAGSEDIYLQSNGELDSNEEEYDEAGNGDGEDVEEELDFEPPQGSNIEAIGLDEINCEFSCPRYYRPVCVSRDDQLITYATPCEFLNQLRCASVARRRGQATPTFQLLYNNACKENAR